MARAPRRRRSTAGVRPGDGLGDDCSLIVIGGSAGGAAGARRHLGAPAARPPPPAAGIEAVHRAGGMTLVQDPATAQFRAMPEAAIASGAVDRVVPLMHIGAELSRLARGGRRAARTVSTH